MDNRYYKSKCPQYSMYQSNLTSYVDTDSLDQQIRKQNNIKNNSNDFKTFLQNNASKLMLTNFSNLIKNNSCQFSENDPSGNKLCQYCCNPKE